MACPRPAKNNRRALACRNRGRLGSMVGILLERDYQPINVVGDATSQVGGHGQVIPSSLNGAYGAVDLVVMHWSNWRASANPVDAPLLYSWLVSFQFHVCLVIPFPLNHKQLIFTEGRTQVFAGLKHTLCKTFKVFVLSPALFFQRVDVVSNICIGCVRRIPRWLMHIPHLMQDTIKPHPR